MGPMRVECSGKALEFPWVLCDKYGRQRGVSICRHVLARSAPPEFCRPPEGNNPGGLICAECLKTKPRDFVVVCERHTTELVLADFMERASRN